MAIFILHFSDINMYINVLRQLKMLISKMVQNMLPICSPAVNKNSARNFYSWYFVLH